MSLSLIRGQSAGTGRPSAAAKRRSRGTPCSLSQSTRARMGCHAWPCRTARRRAASLAPPTQSGGGDQPRARRQHVGEHGVGRLFRERLVDVRRARGPGRRVHVLEGDKRPGVRGDVLRPRRLDRRQVVVGDGAPTVERDADRLELLLRPADADAHDEPAPAQLIHAGQRPRRVQRMAVGDDDHRRADLDAARDAGEPAQRGEGLVERRRVARLDVGRDGHVVGRHQEVIPEPLGDLDPSAEPLRRGAGAEVDEVDADFHFTPSRMQIMCAGM